MIAGDYDIELYRNETHNISNKPVFRYPKRQEELLQLFETVMLEIDKRLDSWSSQYEPTTDDQLKLYHHRGVRLYGRFVSWDFAWREAARTTFCTCIGGFAYVLFMDYHQPRYGWVLAIASVVLFAISTWLNLWYVRSKRFRAGQ